VKVAVLDADRIDRADWTGIIDSLERVVEYYDRMNSLTTLFQADKWRMAAIPFFGEDLDVLEIGSGPGSFTKHIIARNIVCVEPSDKLIRVARGRLGDRADSEMGVAEHLPMRSESFDRVFSSFSFRDFLDKRKSLEEMYRVLREGGTAVIVEIARRSDRAKDILMKWYQKYTVPLISYFVVPREEMRRWDVNPYSELWKTYRKFEPVERYVNMMKEIGFKGVNWKLLSMGGAFMLWGSK